MKAMRKVYRSPVLRTISFTAEAAIFAEAITQTSGNSGISYGGGGTGPARTRRDLVWDFQWYGWEE